MVTKEDIIKLAKLGKLYLTEEELESAVKDMTNIIGFANEISKVDTGDTEFDNINGLENALREDIVEESFDEELILKNADGGKDGFFYIKKYQN